MDREIGEHSKIPIVTVSVGEEIPFDSCPACLSESVDVKTTKSQNVNFLEPVWGEPYPTFAVHWKITTMVTCIDCGCSWGASEIIGDRIPPEDIAIDEATGLPINDPIHFGY